jgi:hypothetical protein
MNLMSPNPSWWLLSGRLALLGRALEEGEEEKDDEEEDEEEEAECAEPCLALEEEGERGSACPLMLCEVASRMGE